MKNLSIINLILILSLWGCSQGDPYKAFPAKKSVEVPTEYSPQGEVLEGDFLPYVHPHAKLTIGQSTVLIGYIVFAEEHIKGVAYLVDDKHEILDTLDISILDPPGSQWGTVDSTIKVYWERGSMEINPNPSAPKDGTFKWVYEISNQKFKQISEEFTPDE